MSMDLMEALELSVGSGGERSVMVVGVVVVVTGGVNELGLVVGIVGVAAPPAALDKIAVHQRNMQQHYSNAKSFTKLFDE
ncbi:unnamed protein product [Linum tenue]|uniref:Uncharacterized protein n=1 Tax=Linum tenue TaxID=586396 RepID=A0AAV0H4K3_9ROSI|nr:unnamed protein product [Linum tenue]